MRVLQQLAGHRSSRETARVRGRCPTESGRRCPCFGFSTQPRRGGADNAGRRIHMEIVLFLGIGLIMAFATASIAGSKGRDRGAWGLLGFFFGLIALIVACCLSDRRSYEEME